MFTYSGDRPICLQGRNSLRNWHYHLQQCPSRRKQKLRFLTNLSLISSVTFILTVLLVLIVSQSQDVGAIGNLRLLEKKILDQIIGEGHYDSRIRPSGANASKDSDGPCIVRINIFLRSISKISDLDMEYSTQLTFRQQWKDERLQYDDKRGQIRHLVLTDPEKIWKPDLFFRNEKDGHFHNIIMPNVLLRIHPDGNVLYSIRISLVLSCPMDLKYYPLDRQTCSISMASYGYTTEDLVFIWKEEDPVQVTKSLHLPRFTLQKFKTDSCTSRTNTGEYSCLKVDLLFRREFSYYLIQIYIPCCMLVIVSWVSFWLDPNAIPARVSLGVTTLLTMATQISGINASLPPVSYTKAIDVWTGSCLTFVFGALLEFALVNYASRSDAHRAQAERLFQAQQQALLQAAMQQRNQGQFHPPAQQLTNELRHSATTNSLHRHHRHRQSAGSTQQRQASLKSTTSAGNVRTSTSAHSWDNGLDVLLNDVEAQFISQQQQQQRKSSGGTTTTGILGRLGLRSPVDDTEQETSTTAAANALAASFSIPSSMASDGLMPSIFGPSFIPSSSAGASRKRKGNIWTRWLSRFPNRSKRIDVISRIFFPLMFAFFNVVYWVTYLWRDDLMELE